MGHRRSGGRFLGGKVGRLTLAMALMGALLVLSPAPALAIATVIPGQSFSIDEDAAATTFVGTVAATATNGLITAFSIVSGNTGTAFAIDAGGVLTVAGVLDYETTPSYALGVTATDGDGEGPPETVTVNVTDVGPVVNPGGPFSVAENATGGTTVGTVTATGTTTGFSIVSGNTGTAFAISSGGVVTVAGALDFETTPTYTLGITANNGAETSATVTFTVNVTDVGPVVNPGGPFSVAENVIGGTTVGTVTATGTTTGFSIVSGNTGTAFAISSGGVVTVAGALDFETTPTYTLGITANNGAETSATVTFTVNVTNVYDGPIVNPAGPFSVAENATGGTTVGTVTAAPGSNGPTTGFSIVSGNTGTAFAISSGGVVTVAGALDFETTPTYTLGITATDGAETSATVTFTVNVTDVDDATPTITGGTGTFPLAENVPVGTVVTTITATDPDSTIVYSISAGNGAGAFTIGATSGVITTATALDFDTTPTYTLTVRATGGTAFDEGTVIVNVTNINEPPMVIVPTSTVVAEEDAPFTPVITFTDPDAADTHTYTIDWGDGTTPSSGAATSPLGVAHTYATNDTFTATVRVTDSGTPTLFDEEIFDVEVVDDPIAMTAGPAQAITEGSAVTITASFTDGAFTHTATVDWGDRTPISATGVTIDQKADTVSATHTYNTKGDADGETDFVPTIRLTRTTGSGVGTASVPVKMKNSAPVIDKFLITDAVGIPKTTFNLGEVTKVTVEIGDSGVDDTHEVRISWQDGTPDFYRVVPGTGSAKRTFTATHRYAVAAPQTITAIIDDGEGGTVSKDAATIFITAGGGAQLETVGLVDPDAGFWSLRNSRGDVTSFFYGNPGDFPVIGDWDCDGDETPGMYRQSDGFVYLRNSNTQGVADIKFFFGNPGDTPIVGDFDGDGCDTVSIYRPSQSKVFVINTLGKNNGGLGAAEIDYFFGNPGDKPFVGDFDGDGKETIGLHRESTGLVYFRNSHTQGVADNEFIFGDPDDRLVAGDWILTGIDSPAVFRPSNTTFYFRHTNTQGIADNEYGWGDTPDLPVAGNFGLG